MKSVKNEAATAIDRTVSPPCLGTGPSAKHCRTFGMTDDMGPHNGLDVLVQFSTRHYKKPRRVDRATVAARGAFPRRSIPGLRYTAV